jgi:hypothetical protein
MDVALRQGAPLCPLLRLKETGASLSARAGSGQLRQGSGSANRPGLGLPAAAQNEQTGYDIMYDINVCSCRKSYQIHSLSSAPTYNCGNVPERSCANDDVLCVITSAINDNYIPIEQLTFQSAAAHLPASLSQAALKIATLQTCMF